MALPANGSISISQVNTELKKSSTSRTSLNDSDVRKLADKPSGQIAMHDLHGKSNKISLTISGYMAVDGGNLIVYIDGVKKYEHYGYGDISYHQDITDNKEISIQCYRTYTRPAMDDIPVWVIWNDEKVFTYEIDCPYNETITKQIDGKNQIIEFD